MSKDFFLRNRPSFWLGLFIVLVCSTFAAFLSWELLFEKYTLFGVATPTVTNWPLTIGTFTALIGWMFSSWVTLRNSIKQHTFNIWLQTRCSAKYMEHAEAMNRLYFSRGKKVALSKNDLNSESFKDIEQSLVYILNHYEFVAVGIRFGDLDEEILKQTMRGIVVSLYQYVELYIIMLQEGRPSAYEHLTALYLRWK